MNPHDHLRDALRDYHVPVDKAELWAKTAHAIPDRRRRRVLPLWWFGALAGAGLVVLGLIVLPARLRTHAMQPIDQPAQLSEASAVDPNHDASRTAEASQQQDNSPSAPSALAGHTPASPQMTPSANLTSRGVSAVVMKSSATPALDDMTSAGDGNPLSTARNQQADAEDQPVDNPILQTSSMPIIDPRTTDQEARDISGTQSFRMQSQAREMGIADPVEVLPVSGLVHDEPGPAVLLPAPAWEYSKIPPAFYMSVLSGIGFSGVSIEASGVAGQPDAERWQESLKSLEYLTASLEGGVRLPKGWQAGLGLRYGQLTTAQTFQWTTTERIPGEGTSTVIIGEDGSTTSVTGDVTSTRRTTSEATRYTYHRTLDLDLLLAVPLWRRPGFTLSGWLRGGVNLGYAVEGSVPDADWRPMPIDPASTPYTLSSPFTWGAGLEARYQLSRHFSVHARASSDRLRYTLAGEGYDIRFNHHMTSFSLGVGYVR